MFLSRSVIALLIPVLACDGGRLGFTTGIGGPIGGGDSVPATISIVSGDGQTATVGSPLPDSLMVLVRDAGGQAVSGVAVQWTVTGGGGTLATATSTTDAAGHAANRLTVGAAVGPQAVTAALQSDVSINVTFTATATEVSGTAAVTVADDSFTPANATVQAGGVVTWTWAVGASTHNVTWVSGGFADSGDRSAGTFQLTFGAAGTFNYYCSIHGTPTTGMRGTVTATN
jgi:plastocyanin